MDGMTIIGVDAAEGRLRSTQGCPAPQTSRAVVHAFMPPAVRTLQRPDGRVQRCCVLGPCRPLTTGRSGRGVSKYQV